MVWEAFSLTKILTNFRATVLDRKKHQYSRARFAGFTGLEKPNSTHSNKLKNR